MLRFEGWQLGFVMVVFGVATVLLGYVEVRRLLCSAVDDRYGQWARFWTRAKGWGEKLDYGISFLFCYGVHDLIRWFTLLAFDLFVILALLSPFWRYVFFDDWNPSLAVSIAVACILVYVVWRVREGLQLCRLHDWSPETWQCARCGEYHAHAEEEAKGKKSDKPTAVATGLWSKLSWHGFWERRLQRLNESVSQE